MKTMKTVILAMVCMVFIVAEATGQGTQAKSWVLKYNQLEPPSTRRASPRRRSSRRSRSCPRARSRCRTYASGTLFTQVGEVTAMMNGDLELSTLAFQDMAPYVPTAGHVRGPVRLHELRAHGEGLRQELEGRRRLLRDDFREVQLHAPGGDDAGLADPQPQEDGPRSRRRPT